MAVRSLPALQRRLPLYEVLTPEQLDRIHDTAMRVLEEIGIDFREDEALAIWAKAGAKVDGARVRIPRELLMGLVAKAPERFTLHARDPATVGRDRRRHAWCSARPTARPSCAASTASAATARSRT